MPKLTVTVKPNSTKGPLIETVNDNTLIIYVREVADDGKANNKVIDLLSKYYDVPKSHISIERGLSSRHKIISIE